MDDLAKVTTKLTLSIRRRRCHLCCLVAVSHLYKLRWIENHATVCSVVSFLDIGLHVGYSAFTY